MPLKLFAQLELFAVDNLYESGGKHGKEVTCLHVGS